MTILNKSYPEKLRFAAKALKMEGFDLSAEWVFESADRMERMEKYIVELHSKLYPDEVPHADGDGQQSQET